MSIVVCKKNYIQPPKTLNTSKIIRTMFKVVLTKIVEYYSLQLN